MPCVKTQQLLFLCFLAMLTFFAACSERNAQSPIDPDTGGHSANWLPAAHMEAAKSDIDLCSSCHGADFKGGMSGVSCTTCHLGSPTSVHPPDWVPVYSTHGSYAKTNSTAACANQYCHGTSLAGVSNSGPSCTSCHLGGTASVHPPDWGSNIVTVHGTFVDSNGNAGCANVYCHGASLTGVTNSGSSCYSCHLGGVGSFHPSSWGTSTTSVILTHADYVKTNGSTACANAACHGTNLSGVANSGPACVSCHVNGSYPFTSTGCVSCHGNPPAGAVYPNIAGKHAQHMQLNGVTCVACHARSSDQHFNGVVDVIFDPSGPAVAAGTPSPYFDSMAKTCSNIACHIVAAGTYSYYFPDGTGNAVLNTVNIYGNTGGTTPSWYSTVSTSCTACHNDPPRNGTDGSNIWHSGYHGGQGPTEPYNQCQLCHPDASSPGNSIGDTITNPLLHGNGTYNVQPIFSSPCFGCH